MFFKLLNSVFCAKTFFIKVALKYQINLFFKFIRIKTQLITRYYHPFYVKYLMFIFVFKRIKRQQSVTDTYALLSGKATY